MKVAPNGPIYLLEKFHIFIRSLDNFTKLFLFLCHWKKENEIWKSVFIFLSGWAHQPDLTRLDPQPRAPAGPALQQLPPSFPNPPSCSCARAPRRANPGRPAPRQATPEPQSAAPRTRLPVPGFRRRLARSRALPSGASATSASRCCQVAAVRSRTSLS
jgi:hypothetical protein